MIGLLIYNNADLIISTVWRAHRRSSPHHHHCGYSFLQFKMAGSDVEY